MSDKNIKELFDEIEMPVHLKEKILTSMDMDKVEKPKEKRIFRLKPIMVAAIVFSLVVTTAAASAPFILRMLGSDIGFFESDKQTLYSADQEVIKQYSSAVGITAEAEGFSLTMDNVAFDGTFMNVFYTIKSEEVNLYEEAAASIKKSGSPHYRHYADTALGLNQVILEIPGYELLYDTRHFLMRDGYFVSDYELKGMQRYIIGNDLPDVFNIEFIYNYFNNRPEIYKKYWIDEDTPSGLAIPPISINLTLDLSESRIETLVVEPNVYATVAQEKLYSRSYSYDIIEHNITIDKVSISPLGNILAFTTAGSNSYETGEIFSNYFIVDDKGHFYGKTVSYSSHPQNSEENEKFLIEFYGNVPSDAQYLKLLPYNLSGIAEWEEHNGELFLMNYQETEAKISNLPQKVVESEYGSVIIESCIVTDNDITVNYRYEGMVDLGMRFSFTAGEMDLRAENMGWYSTSPIYNRHTDSYSYVFTFTEPRENAADIVTGVKIRQYDIELLEEQAIIIPLR
jgi:hypothetical protein